MLELPPLGCGWSRWRVRFPSMGAVAEYVGCCHPLLVVDTYLGRYPFASRILRYLDTFTLAPLSMLLGSACVSRHAAIDRLLPTSHCATWHAVKAMEQRSLSLQVRIRAVGVSARVPHFPLAIGRPPLARICEGPARTGCALGLRLGGHSRDVYGSHPVDSRRNNA